MPCRAPLLHQLSTMRLSWAERTRKRSVCAPAACTAARGCAQCPPCSLHVLAVQFSDWAFRTRTLHFRASVYAQCPSCSDAIAQVYALTKEEGGRHTPFFSNYKPQFFFRTADITGAGPAQVGCEVTKRSERGWQAVSAFWQNCPAGSPCNMGLRSNRLPCTL